MHKWKSVEKGNKMCQWLKKDHVLYLFFRGTKGRKEWWWNVAPDLGVNIEGVRVDKYDYLQGRDILHALPDEALLGAHQYKIYGHSRGFGPAVVVGTMLAYLTLGTDIQLWGIAGKRTVKPFSRYTPYDHRVKIWHNMYHNGDIVPFLPPFFKKGGQVAIGERMKPIPAHWESVKMAAKIKQEIASV